MTLKNTEQVLLSDFAYDAADAPSPAPGPVTWSTPNTDIVTLDTLVGPTTTARTVDNASGFALVTAAISGLPDATFELEVVGGEVVAVRHAIVAGTPEPKLPVGVAGRSAPPSRPSATRGPTPLRR